jgi:hypothetical protein
MALRGGDLNAEKARPQRVGTRSGHHGLANPALTSMPLLAQTSEMASPARQNTVSTFHVMWTFDAFVEMRDRAWSNSTIWDLQTLAPPSDRLSLSYDIIADPNMN